MYMYIENIRKKCGSFHLVKTRTPFELSKYNDCIRDLISQMPSFSSISAIQNHENDSMDDNVSTTIGETSEISDAGQTENDEETIRSEFNMDENMDTDSNEAMLSDNDLETSTSDDAVNSVNISEYKRSFKNVAMGFGRICKMNEMLKTRLKHTKKRNELKFKTFKETNSKLMAENGELKVKTLNQKKDHDREMTQLKKNHQRKIEEQKQAMEQLGIECLRRCL